MPEIRLDEKIVELMNPLPDVELAELAKRAGVLQGYRPREMTGKAFTIDMRWGVGARAEHLILEPQSNRAIPESIARTMEKKWAHRGLILIRPGDNAYQAMLEGCRKALESYRRVGSEQLIDQRARHGYTDEELRRVKHLHKNIYLAIEKEKAIEEWMQLLEELGAEDVHGESEEEVVRAEDGDSPAAA